MSAGFKVMRAADNGFKMIRPLKMTEAGPIETSIDFSIQVDAQGRLLSACGVEVTPPTRRPIDYRTPCNFHIEKMVPLVTTVPQESPGLFIPMLMGRPLTQNGIYIPQEHRDKLIRYELRNGELYRIARDLHRVDVRLSTTEGYNFELAMHAIANGATPIKFNVANGVEMAAFFVIGTDWVHTVSSIKGLYFGVGVVDATFVDFFKSVIVPYIEVDKYNG